MNIRNPFSRLRSWYRIFNDRLNTKISCEQYIKNLHTEEFAKIEYAYQLDSVESGIQYKYVIPLHHWYDILAKQGAEEIQLVCQETLSDDLIKLGYEDKNKSDNDKDKWEHQAADGVDDILWYKKNPWCAEIVRAYYAKDFELFNYSDNLNRMYDASRLSSI
jgi:hypothetical protein